MPPIPSRMSSPALDLDRAPSASNTAPDPSGPAPRPGRPTRPVRRAGVSMGRIVAFLVLLAAVAACVWLALRTSGEASAASGSDEPSAWASASEEARAAALAFLCPGEDEVSGLYRIVEQSDFIRDNPAYADIVSSISFHYLPEDDVVNAFASPVDRIAGTETPCIRLLGGWVRMSRVIGATVAAHSFGTAFGVDPEKRMLELLPAALARTGSTMSVEEAFSLLEACGVRPSLFLEPRFLVEATNIADGDCLACIGHEVGHIAYHHVDRLDVSDETRRNQERDADSFAMSIAREERQYMEGRIEQYMFIGSVYENYVFSLLDARLGRDGDDRNLNHPCSSERLFNLLRSKTELSETYGLSVAGVEQSLRKATASSKR